MERHRLRIRFRKTDDLRQISHRDLARVWERLFRRSRLALAMSQGFHPHPKISFPSALAVGIEGRAEVVEVTLTENVEASAALERLVQHAPPGLVIENVTALEDSHPKAAVERMTYEIEIPAERQGAVASAIQQVLACEHVPFVREGRAQPLDVRAALVACQLEGGRLRFSLRDSGEAQVRPREILAVLGVDDLEHQGSWLTRTEVVLEDESPAKQGAAR